MRSATLVLTKCCAVLLQVGCITVAFVADVFSEKLPVNAAAMLITAGGGLYVEHAQSLCGVAIE